MPRDVAGVYTLPNVPVVTNTTISSTDENQTRSDMASELTNSLDRSGRGTMFAPLALVDGSPSLPGLTFATDVNTGVYRISADVIGFAVAGALALKIAATGVSSEVQLSTPIVDSIAGTLVLKGAGVTAVTITGGTPTFAGTIIVTTQVTTPVVTSQAGSLVLKGAGNVALTITGTNSVFSGVVTTSILDSGTGSLVLKGATVTSLTITGANSVFAGATQSTTHTATTSVVTPIVDSGSTGSLLLKTNNGTTQFSVDHAPSAVNYFRVLGNVTGTPPILEAFGSDANIEALFRSKGTSGLRFQTNSGSQNQFEVLHTAGATRNATITGSNTAGIDGVLGTSSTGSILLANGQLKFPAAQNASADANTLDDYEEGTWTPSVGGTATYSAQSGTYTKCGRAVAIHAQMDISTIGTGSTITVSGAPFTPTPSRAVGAANVPANSATAVVSISAVMSSGSSAITIKSRTAASAGDAANAIFQNGTNFSLSMGYEV